MLVPDLLGRLTGEQTCEFRDQRLARWHLCQ